MGMLAFHITAYADHGHSGAPVMSSRGRLLGLVVHGVGVAIMQVAFVPVNVIHTFLTTGEPGLPGLMAPCCTLHHIC